MYEVPRFEDSILIGPEANELRCRRWVPRGDGTREDDRWFCTRHAGHTGDCVAHIIFTDGWEGTVAATWPREVGKDYLED